MAYNSHKHGRAEYGSWTQIKDSDSDAVSAYDIQGSDNIPLELQKFAQLVYQVNPSPINLSGDVTIDNSGVISAVNGLSATLPPVLLPNYATIVKVDGNDTYVMKASTGTTALSGSAVWQVKKISDDGVTTEIMFADGNSNFDNIAADYLTLTYSF